MILALLFIGAQTLKVSIYLFRFQLLIIYSEPRINWFFSMTNDSFIKIENQFIFKILPLSICANTTTQVPVLFTLASNPKQI